MGATYELAHGRRSVLFRSAILAILAAFVLQLPAEAATTKIVRSGPRSSGGVALTFDDGWGGAACESIAATLRRERVVGTFFINGVYLRSQPKRWRRILKDMPVASHTRSHPWLTRVSSEEIRRQLISNERVHEQLLGRPMLKVVRPPYGAYDSRVVRVARDLGYSHIVLWSRSAADTSAGASVRSIIRHATGGRKGDIVLMHCARDITAQALPAIIRHYKRRGIRLIGLDEMLGLKSPRPPKPWEVLVKETARLGLPSGQGDR